MPQLPVESRASLAKAREAALLAVETYNRPTCGFRSSGYIVLMTIAWTALLHAVFFRARQKPFHKKKNRFVKVDGDRKAWELAECVRQFYGQENPPQRKNIEFFLKLRNKIEHRQLPPLDRDIFGECQALLLNFENLLCDKFGERQAMGLSLSFALQLSRERPDAQARAMRGLAKRQLNSVRKFIEEYRSALSQDVYGKLEYSFRVFLVPKLSSNPKAADLAVEFVPYDPAKPEEMAKLEQIVTLIKPKEVPIANLGALTPSEVAARVRNAITRPFTMDSHTRCWRHFSARPPSGSPSPGKCNPRFCHYDALHKDYGYTETWVEFLVEKLSDQATYDLIVTGRKIIQAAPGPARAVPVVASMRLASPDE